MKMPRIAWILIAGLLLVRMAIFMSYPFLALHLEKMHFDAMDIGIILGCPYFFAGLSGIFGGNIADQIGKQRTMVITLIMAALAFWGLGQVESFTGFLLCNLVLATATATFEPAASTLITESVSEDLQALVLRYRYMAINIGASIGPIIGTLLALYGTHFAFFITGTLLASYSLFFLFFRKSNQTVSAQAPYSLDNFKSAVKHMAGHKSFLLLLVANFFIHMTYCQIFSTLPQILNSKIEDSFHLYSILITTNPITVVIVGLFFSHYLSKQDSRRLFSIGCLLLAVTFLGFQFSPVTYFNFISLMILFTLAEMILIPTSAKFLIDLAPKEHRGTYLGSESCFYLGSFMGNLIGGFLLQTVGGVFLFCSLCSVVGFFLYRLACQKTEIPQPAEVVKNASM